MKQSCLPARYKEVHVINEPFICKVVMQILKPIIPQKLRKRVSTILLRTYTNCCSAFPPTLSITLASKSIDKYIILSFRNSKSYNLWILLSRTSFYM